MDKLTVALAADHAGFSLKEELKTELAQLGFACIDLGTDSPASVDYPDFGTAVFVLGLATMLLILGGTRLYYFAASALVFCPATWRRKSIHIFGHCSTRFTKCWGSSASQSSLTGP